MQKWVIAIAALLIVVALGALLVIRSGYNPAEQEANHVLNGFSATVSGNWYCENGAPSGIVNDTPWWEEIYVSQVSIDEMAKSVVTHLASKGYMVEKKFIENSKDNYSSNQGKTYWEVEGTREQFQVEGRIIAHDLTLNNCFPRSSNIDETIDPKNYASVIVIQFKDNSQ